MSKLVRFLDSKSGCWSRIDLANGDPIWISIASNGILVKKSRLGLLGAKLYFESDIEVAASTAQSLHAGITKYVVPDLMVNAVLRAFTQTALECKSANELSKRLKAVSMKVSGPTSLNEQSGQKTRARQKIISVYGRFIKEHPTVGEFRDSSELPFSKVEILDAITFAIICETDDKRVDALKGVALLLADYQSGVGEKPISMLGIDAADLSDDGNKDLEALKALATKIADNPDRKKYEVLKKRADEELIDIQSKLNAAEQLRSQMPEEKKSQILR